MLVTRLADIQSPKACASLSQTLLGYGMLIGFGALKANLCFAAKLSDWSSQTAYSA